MNERNQPQFNPKPKSETEHPEVLQVIGLFAAGCCTITHVNLLIAVMSQTLLHKLRRKYSQLTFQTFLSVLFLKDL